MLVGMARKIASDSHEFWEATQARSYSVAFLTSKQMVRLDSRVASRLDPGIQAGVHHPAGARRIT